jgi:hypothetical protein
LNLYNQGQEFRVLLSSTGTADLTGAVVSFRVRLVAGGSGGITVFAKNGEANNWASFYSAWRNFSDITEWSTLTLNLGTSSAPFNPAQVLTVGVALASGGEYQGSVLAPATVEVDSITVSGADVGPWDFTETAGDIEPDYMPLAGTSVTWLPPE